MNDKANIIGTHIVEMHHDSLYYIRMAGLSQQATGKGSREHHEVKAQKKRAAKSTEGERATSRRACSRARRRRGRCGRTLLPEIAAEHEHSTTPSGSSLSTTGEPGWRRASRVHGWRGSWTRPCRRSSAMATATARRRGPGRDSSSARTHCPAPARLEGERDR